MNMKNTVILLIFLLSVLGLIMGVHCTESVDDADSQNQDSDDVADENSAETITLTDNENNVLTNFFS